MTRPKKKTFCKMCPKWEIKHPERCSNTVKAGRQTLYFCTKRCKDKYIEAKPRQLLLSSNLLTQLR